MAGDWRVVFGGPAGGGVNLGEIHSNKLHYAIRHPLVHHSTHSLCPTELLHREAAREQPSPSDPKHQSQTTEHSCQRSIGS